MKIKKIILAVTFVLISNVYTAYSQSFSYASTAYLVEGSKGPKWLDVCGNESGNSCSTPKSSSWRELSWAEKFAYYSIKTAEEIDSWF